MPVQEFTKTAKTRSIAETLVDDRIVQIVNERFGIKETDLLMEIQGDLIERDRSYDPNITDISTEMIFSEIQYMINQGRIIGVDCHIKDSGYTFLLPAGTTVHAGSKGVCMPSHDFNNLLMIILGNLEILRKRISDNPRLLGLVDGAIQGTKRLSLKQIGERLEK